RPKPPLLRKNEAAAPLPHQRSRSGSSMKNCRAALLRSRRGLSAGRRSRFIRACALNLGRTLADAAAQVVQLRTAHTAGVDHFDTFHSRAVQGENTLHTFTVGNLPHGKGTVDALAATASDHNPLKDLNALLSAFNHLGMHANGVPHVELWDRRLLVLFLDLLNYGMRTHDSKKQKGSPPGIWRVLSVECLLTLCNGIFVLTASASFFKKILLATIRGAIDPFWPVRRQ